MASYFSFKSSVLEIYNPGYWINQIESEPLTLSQTIALKEQLKSVDSHTYPFSSKLLIVFNKIINSFFITENRFEVYPWDQKKSEILYLQLTVDFLPTGNVIRSRTSVIKTVKLGIYHLSLKAKKPEEIHLQKITFEDGYIPFPISDSKPDSNEKCNYSLDNSKQYMPLSTEVDCGEQQNVTFSDLAIEEAFHSFLNNDHIIKYFPCYKEGILMEKIFSPIDIYALQCFPISRLFLDTLKGITYLNQLGLVHGDIKESNLAIIQAPTLSELNFKTVLLDFGSTTFIGSNAKPCDKNYASPQKAASITYLYNFPVSISDDIWSLGATAANICANKQFTFYQFIQADASNGFIALNPNFHIPHNAAHFIYSCLHYDSIHRISLEDALKHPFINNIKKPQHLEFRSYLPDLTTVFQKYIEYNNIEGLPFASSPISDLIKQSSEYTRVHATEDVTIHFLNHDKNIDEQTEPKYFVHIQISDKYFLIDFESSEFVRLLKIAINQSYAGSKNSIEYVNNETCEHLEDNYWDLNTNDPWAKKHKSTYRDLFYPSIIEYLNLNTDIKLNSVLELCGGNGEFYNTLKSHRRDIDSYSILEFNQSSLEHAKQTFRDDPTITLLKGDVTKEASYKELQAVLKSKGKPLTFDCIIGLGALTFQVMPNKEAALSALRWSYDHLNSQGYIILRGLAASYINKFDLETQGFEVKETFAFTNQFYVALKA